MKTRAEALLPQFLADLIKKCELLSFDEWSRILNVDQWELTHWFDGDSGPTAKEFRTINDILIRDIRFAPLLNRFNAILDMPASEAVGPNASWGGALPDFGPTLRHYMTNAIWHNFLDSIRTLSPKKQEKLYFEFSRMIREERSKD